MKSSAIIGAISVTLVLLVAASGCAGAAGESQENLDATESEESPIDTTSIGTIAGWEGVNMGVMSTQNNAFRYLEVGVRTPGKFYRERIVHGERDVPERGDYTLRRNTTTGQRYIRFSILSSSGVEVGTDRYEYERGIGGVPTDVRFRRTMPMGTWFRMHGI